MIRLIIYFSCTILTVLFFKQIDETLINWNFSWTLSKTTPYLLLIILGSLIAYEIVKKVKNSKKFIKIILCFLITPSPFLIGFAINPIYEGDYSKDGDVLKNEMKNNDFNENGLSVLSIPGCHFCSESIEKLKKIKKRNPKLSITFIVLSRDLRALTKYKKEINGVFKLKLASNPDNFAVLAQLKFPAFLIIKNKKPIYRWSNDQFGVRAIDLLEAIKK